MTAGRPSTTASLAQGSVVLEEDAGSASAAMMRAVMVALDAVRDPELDEPVTDLGFVAGVNVEAGRVEVALRLPTYFCAPNFAWLMVHDARVALESVPGVTEAQVRLMDHFSAEEINAGVGEGRQFDEAFAGLADGELDELRQVFRRKAFAARQDRLCRAMLGEGVTAEKMAQRRLGELPAGAVTDLYLQRRAELGLDVSPGALFLVDNAGAPVAPDRVAVYLRRLRTIAVSIETNAGFCRGLLATRYPSDTK